MSNSLINKRIVAVIAAAASVFSLTACGSGTSKNDTEASKDVQVVNIAGVTGKNRIHSLTAITTLATISNFWRRLMKNCPSTNSSIPRWLRMLCLRDCRVASMMRQRALSTVLPSVLRLLIIPKILRVSVMPDWLSDRMIRTLILWRILRNPVRNLHRFRRMMHATLLLINTMKSILTTKLSSKVLQKIRHGRWCA